MHLLVRTRGLSIDINIIRILTNDSHCKTRRHGLLEIIVIYREKDSRITLAGSRERQTAPLLRFAGDLNRAPDGTSKR